MSMPSSARTFPKLLTRPSASIADVGIAPPSLFACYPSRATPCVPHIIADESGHLLSGFRENLGACARTDSWRCCSSSRRQGRVTAAELADELEISERTARRDLEALGARGHPRLFPGGAGRRVVAGGRRAHRPERLDRRRGSHAVPRRRAVGFRDPADQGRAPQARSRAPGAVPSGGRVGGRGRGAGPHELGPNERAASRAPRRPAASRRGRRAGATCAMRVATGPRPSAWCTRSGLVAKASVWYLVAGTDAGLRTFRLSRIRDVTVTDEPAERPEGFDLAETWKEIVDTIDERREWFRAVALADPEAVPMAPGRVRRTDHGRRPGPRRSCRGRDQELVGPYGQARSSRPSAPGSRSSILPRFERIWRALAPSSPSCTDRPRTRPDPRGDGRPGHRRRPGLRHVQATARPTEAGGSPARPAIASSSPSSSISNALIVWEPASSV